MAGSLERWWSAAQHAAAILKDATTTPGSWHQMFQQRVLPELPCFGPYWSKYVYGAHIAGDKADLHDFSIIGPGCEKWLRLIGLQLGNGAQQVQERDLQALRELRDIVNHVIESKRHRGIEEARAAGRLEPLTAYDIQVQACECKRGYGMISATVAAMRAPLHHGSER